MRLISFHHASTAVQGYCDAGTPALLGYGIALGYDDLPRLTTRTAIGLAVAVSGNILISLALNLQKLAHKRVEKTRKASSRSQQHENSNQENDEYSPQTSAPLEEDVFLSNATPGGAELQPLTAHPEPMIRDYGSEPSRTSPGRQIPKFSRSIASRFSPFSNRKKTSTKFLLPVEIVSEDAILHGLPTTNSSQSTLNDTQDLIEENEGDYLKSKLWWMGFLLMNVGEMGNFISYAFAPASVVAPLGTFALMANCFFAPLLLNECFRKRDLLGVAIAIVGAVTVVLASNASDTRLDSDGLLRAISQTAFIVYSCLYVAGAIALATLSEGKIGKTWVFVDVGLCALFGGFTVLSTKAFSTLLTLEWIDILTKWITYPLITVLILTGVGQIRYLNRALMRFDSKVVIPVQFVLFTLSAIVGSATLYGDFQKAEFHQIITFLYGCAATFAGVFIIAWTPKDSRHREAEFDAEDSDHTNIDSSPTQSASGTLRLGLGTFGKQQRTTLGLPSGVTTPRDTPVLRHKRSTIGVMGISPAQHLLLVHSPPREIASRNRDEPDVERGSPITASTRRRWTMSWYGQDSSHPERTDNVIRGNSISGRLRNEVGRVGSLEA